MRIGIFGAFDIAGYSNLLFPLIAEHELKQRFKSYEVVRYSLSEKSEPSWPFSVSSVAELAGKRGRRHGLDGVLIDARVDSSGCQSLTAQGTYPASHWIIPGLAGIISGVPVVWNTSDSLDGLAETGKRLLALMLNSSAHVSLGERRDITALRIAGFRGPCHIVPDATFALSRHVSSAELSRKVEGIVGRLGLTGKRYIVVQATKAVTPLLGWLADLSDLEILALAAAPAQGDDVAYVQSRWSQAKALTEWHSPLEIAGLVAGSAGILAECRQLSATGLAYGVPVLLPVETGDCRYTGLRRSKNVYFSSPHERSGTQAFVRATLSEARQICPLVFSMQSRLAKHWDQVAKVCQPSKRSRQALHLTSFSEASQLLLRMYEFAVKRSVTSVAAHGSEAKNLRATIAAQDVEGHRIRSLLQVRDTEVNSGVTQLAAIEKKFAALEGELKERDRHIAKLEAEIRLRADQTRRVRPSLRKLIAIANDITFYFGRAISLRPLHDIQSPSAGQPGWTMTGIDPQIELIWPGFWALKGGHYRLSIGMPDGSADLAFPQLYIDSGGGFNEAERIDLYLCQTRRVQLSATFSLCADAQRLRLDPSNRPGEIAIAWMRLRRLSWIEHYVGLIRKLSARRIRDRRSLLRVLSRAVVLLSESGPAGLAAALRSLNEQDERSRATYEEWITRYDRITDEGLVELHQRLMQLRRLPLISVLMPVYNTSEHLLREALDSVIRQVYENWELCVADDCSTKSHVRAVLEEYRRRDARIKVVYRKENGNISRASNSAFEMVQGEWVAMLDHDDVLRPNALAEVALEIDRNPDAELIYSDEDKIDRQGTRYDPFFKPDFSRELFRSQNYLNHLTVHRAQNIRAVGGWRPGFEGSQDYDLNLRIFERIDSKMIRHIPKILYHWRAVEGSAALDKSQKEYAYEAGLRALEDHLQRIRLAANVQAASLGYRVRLSIPEPPPLVSLIIPTKDKVDLLRACIESIRKRTTYQNYEIIVVDNCSQEPETQAYLHALRNERNIQLLTYRNAFNYSAINNRAVTCAKGAIIGLINNDIEVITPDWLGEMVSWALLPDVGCVGAKLYYPNDTIQHAGVITGLGGVAAHSHKHFPREHPGYFGRLKVLQNLSAVTGACLVVRKEIYNEVGGFNEKDLKVAFNDVDFCLRVQMAGYHNVWTPYAELYHRESPSRGAEDTPEKIARFHREIGYMTRKWKNILQEDPFYSPNLTKHREDFSLAF